MQSVKHPALQRQLQGSYRYSDSAEELQQKPLAIVTLEMGDQIEEIKVHEGEDVQLLAELFCQRFGLGEECVQYIVDNINEQLRNKAREASPRFQTVGDSFGNKPTVVTQQSRQYQCNPNDNNMNSPIGTTQASSIDENSAQKTYEMWHQQLKQKNDNINTHKTSQPNVVAWNVGGNKGYNEPKKSNPSQRLYQDGLDMQKYKTEQSELIRQHRNDMEFDKATFKPTISPRSRELANKNRRPSKPDNIGQFLYNKGQEQNKKKLDDITKHKQELRKLSPFQPQRLDTSRNTSQVRSTTPVHDKLYQEGREGAKKKEQWQQDEFKKSHPFKPQHSKSPIRSMNKQQQQIFVNKLFNEQEERKKKQQLIRYEDSVKNQQPFQPKITKDSHYLKVSRQTNYEDTQLAQDISKLQSKLVKEYKQPPSPQPQPIQPPDNKQLSNQQKPMSDKIITRIFNQLDSDRDGQISAEQLDLQGIDGDVLEVISEVLYEMEERQLVLNVHKFTELCIQHNIDQQLTTVKI